MCVGPQKAQPQRVSIDAALHTSDRAYVEASGEAAVSARPDQAVISIGVVTQGGTAAGVAVQNAAQAEAVLTELRKTISSADRITTSGYSIQPNYEYPKPGGSLSVKGYVATNIVEVTLNDLTRVGNVIDAATRSGANKVQNLVFKLKNPAALRAEALRQAAAEARSNAEAIAAGLGVRVVKVMSAVEGGGDEDFGAKKKVPPPIPGAPITPIQTETIEVSAAVTLRLEVAQ